MASAIGTLMREVRIEEEVKAARPTPYATEARLAAALSAKPERPRQYMQAVLRLELGGQPEAFRLVSDLAARLEERGAAQLVTAYETAIGRRGELTDLWILPHGVRNFDYRATDPLGDILEPLRRGGPDGSSP